METVRLKTLSSVYEHNIESVNEDDGIIFLTFVQGVGVNELRTTIMFPKSVIPTTSLEDRMRLRHACIQMAIEANLVKSDGTKRNINEVALEFYNFIVK